MDNKITITFNSDLGYPRIVDVSANGECLHVIHAQISQATDSMPILTIKIPMTYVNMVFEPISED